MKLLLDQNLSYRLIHSLEDLFRDAVHVRDVGLKDADDTAVWEYAKQHGFTIVSKDADFHQRSFLLGHPPKVVWVRLGNCSTSDVERLLRQHEETIKAFCRATEGSFLSLSRGA
ncbi:DUF5615 family PIN-like protein [Truepera radiovictrix]|uniref:DUF5615 domain-containing protein n=1 Tax=Truepera radiovictrix (strain DSM 17093 / CIP 108686 / LMG 22925 / RQ-24) TaxID=649638 RepID=D7CTI9_TRURR|nr:conserved hypothetical protein [Truepera radiovictrix DSM 17093]